MRLPSLALVLAFALATAGCLGPTPGGDEVAPASDDADPAGQGPSAQAQPLVNRTHEDAALANTPLIDPNQATGAKATFIKTSYDNGLNGTWIIGYEVDLPEGATKLTVETTAEHDTQEPRPIPDYDVFVYHPDGELAKAGYEVSSDETVTVRSPQAGTYLVALILVYGANAPVTTHITAV